MHRSCAILVLLILTGTASLAAQGSKTGPLLENAPAHGPEIWWYESAGINQGFGAMLDLDKRRLALYGRDRVRDPEFWARFDVDGQLVEQFGQGRVLELRRSGSGYITTFLNGGRTVQRIQRKQAVLDSNLACFLIGFYPLYKTGDEVTSFIALPQPLETAVETREFEARFRVLGRENYTSPAGIFDCLKVDFAFLGIVGHFAPRLTVWIDTVSRRPVAFKGDRKDENSRLRQVVRIEAF